MRIAFTFRNFESSEALKRYAKDKLEKLQNYLHTPLDADVNLSLERHLHCVAVTVHCGGQTYMGREESESMYASVDSVTDKLRRQMERAKGQLAKQRKRTAPAPTREAVFDESVREAASDQ